MGYMGWSVAERLARKGLRKDLKTAVAAAKAARHLVEATIVLRSGAPLERACEVCVRLLAQAANQLRQIELAAEAGYALQALGAGASVYEAVSAIGYIDGDNQRALQWMSHADAERSYPGAKNRKSGTKRLLVAGGVGAEEIEAQLERWEQWYQFFCVGKHLNPVLLRKYGIKEDTEHLSIYLGPVSGPAMRTMSRYALARASHILVGGSLLIAKRAEVPDAGKKARFDRALSRAMMALRPQSAD